MDITYYNLIVFLVRIDVVTKVAPKVKETEKKVRLNLIDVKRGQNAGIALARIRISFADVRDRLSHFQSPSFAANCHHWFSCFPPYRVRIMDDSCFTSDQLKSLQVCSILIMIHYQAYVLHETQEYLPTKEEMQTLQSYSGDQKVLGQAERYMMAMMTLKGAFRRIECMLYKKQFPTRVAEIRGQIEIVEKCSKDVRASVGLKKTLRTILKVGNQMNDGGNVGFTLDSLLKLESAKAFDKKTSILQYVITLVDRSDPGSLSFPEELARVTDASRVSLDTIHGDLADLEKGLEVSKSIAEEMQGDRGLSTEGVDVIGSFLLEVRACCRPSHILTAFLQATNECAKLKEEVTVMKKSFSDTLMYFGEDESMSSVDFFSTLDKFLRVSFR